MDTQQENEKQLYRSITRRYLLAVIIIALLSTSAYFTLQSALSDSDATAYIVNLSGRQRMLSQHIALDSHRFYQAKQENLSLSDLHKSLMGKNIADMRKANKQLSTGVLSTEITVPLSNSIREMYYGDMAVSARVEEYLDIAQKLQSNISSEDKLTYLKLLDTKSEPLLTDLHKVVQQYQLEGEERIGKIERLELIVWLATITALMLEILFIFKPMAVLVTASLTMKNRVLENLERLVEQRTSKLAIANKKLKQIAEIDPLTKLKNRLTLESDLDNLIKVSRQNHVPFALCMIDIDWFKKINDSFGHPTGDHVLKEVAKIMSKTTREYDHLYRVGGEEFVLVLNRVESEEAVSILEKLRIAFETYKFQFENNVFNITVSIGYYHSAQFTISSVKEAILLVDQALYRAKNNGRNRIESVEQQDMKSSTESD
jgi:diguanylate cyclase (GGDEF)-like protein